MVGHLTNIYCPTVGHLIENFLKKSNAPPMPAPPLGLNIDRCINVMPLMRQMFMRQILADAISKLQKITRQMLCDKCYATNVPKMTSHLPYKCGNNTLDPKNADVIWREKSRYMGAIKLLMTLLS